MIKILLSLFILAGLTTFSLAQNDHKDEHEHGHEEEGHIEDHGEEHVDTHEGERADAHPGEGHHDEASASVGPGKAVLEIKNEGRSLKLSPAAQKKINLQSALVISQNGMLKVPKSAILEYQANTAVYKVTKDDFVELTAVTITKREGDLFSIKGSLSAEDKIVVSGVALIRAAQLEASGQGGEGHAH